MARESLTIDSRGMDDMLRQLRKKTGMEMKDVVRGVTAATLTNAAKKTKTGSAKKIDASVMGILKMTYDAKNGDKITHTKAGKIFYNHASWPGNRWILVGNGNFVSIGRTIETSRGTQQVGPAFRGRINSVVSEAKAYMRAEKKYRKARIGSSKATFIYLLRLLNLTPTNTAGLKKADPAKLDSAHKASLGAKQQAIGKNLYNITIRSRSKSALNNHSRGIGAFAKSLNGQIKGFKTAASKDLKTYAKRFAARNGFTVK